jgi:hypothetical protein
MGKRPDRAPRHANVSQLRVTGSAGLWYGENVREHAFPSPLNGRFGHGVEIEAPGPPTPTKLPRCRMFVRRSIIRPMAPKDALT